MTWPRVIITTLVKQSDEVKEKCYIGYILQNDHPSTLTGGRQFLDIQGCNACSQTNPDSNQKSSANLITIDDCVRLEDSYNEENMQTDHAPYRMANCLTNGPSDEYNICYSQNRSPSNSIGENASSKSTQ